ncbi:MAG: GFA family protein [Alteromonadaceae bacterium]|nr:GFA family protein [Alteromonadaceae bacterium]
MSIKGSCLCGEVRFEITGNFESFYLCYCKYCQKDTGSAHAANLFSSSATLQWMSGQSSVNTFQLPSTQHIKSFCACCGSALPSLQMNGKLLVVPAGSLDDALNMTPNARIFTSRCAPWQTGLEDIQSFSELPE